MSDQTLDTNPPFFDLVGQVRTMRRIKPDHVPLALIRRVLEAGVQAPSGMNLQAWSFLAIHKKEDLKWFGEHYKAGILSRFGPLTVTDDDKTPFAKQIRALKYQSDHMHEFPLVLLVAGSAIGRSRFLRANASDSHRRTTAPSIPAYRTSC